MPRLYTQNTTPGCVYHQKSAEAAAGEVKATRAKLMTMTTKMKQKIRQTTGSK